MSTIDLLEVGAPAEAAPEVAPASPAGAESPRPTSRPRPRPAESLFRVVWRWHFYAGMIVAPVLVVMSVTGGLYIFKAEIEEFARRDVMFVAPGAARAGVQAQVDAAVAANPGFVPAQLQLHHEANRATVVTLRPAQQDPAAGREAFRQQLSVYVNPYDGKVLGGVPASTPLNDFFQEVLALHRRLWAGTTGRVLTELTTSWTIVLLATGLYLWWPKGKKPKAAGVWTLRLKAKRYTALRDLHSVGGMYLLPVCFIIAATGMFYTLAVGKVARDASHAWVGEVEAPRGGGGAVKSGRGAMAAAKGEGRRGDARKADATPATPSLPLDDLMAGLRRRYPDRILFATLGGGPGGRGGLPAPPNSLRTSAGNDFNRTYGRFASTEEVLDKATGRVVARKDNSQGGFFLHAWAYPLHVGSFWGLATKIPWLIACAVLTALPITGIWMWWERRPKGKAGLPRKPDVRVPGWLAATIAALCLVLPMMGASVILILLGEGVARLVGRARAAVAA